MGQRPHAGIGLKGGGIYADTLAPQKLLGNQNLQHFGEHRRVNRKWKPPSGLAVNRNEKCTNFRK